jgi:hypothetical protein
MPTALTVPGLAFRSIPSGHDTTPGPRCQACRDRIGSATAWDEHHRPYHPRCLASPLRASSGGGSRRSAVSPSASEENTITQPTAET